MPRALARLARLEETLELARNRIARAPARSRRSARSSRSTSRATRSARSRPRCRRRRPSRGCCSRTIGSSASTAPRCSRARRARRAARRVEQARRAAGRARRPRAPQAARRREQRARRRARRAPAICPKRTGSRSTAVRCAAAAIARERAVLGAQGLPAHPRRATRCSRASAGRRRPRTTASPTRCATRSGGAKVPQFDGGALAVLVRDAIASGTLNLADHAEIKSQGMPCAPEMLRRLHTPSVANCEARVNDPIGASAASRHPPNPSPRVDPRAPLALALSPTLVVLQLGSRWPTRSATRRRSRRSTRPAARSRDPADPVQPPAFGRLPLKTLCLARNRLTAHALDTGLLRGAVLERLVDSTCAATRSSVPRGVWELRALRTLLLSHNRVRSLGAPLPTWRALPCAASLEHIDVASNVVCALGDLRRARRWIAPGLGDSRSREQRAARRARARAS